MFSCHHDRLSQTLFCAGDRKKSFNSGLDTKGALHDSSSIRELDKRRNKKWVGDSKTKDI